MAETVKKETVKETKEKMIKIRLQRTRENADDIYLC